jgi:hypothetical protein
VPGGTTTLSDALAKFKRWRCETPEKLEPLSLNAPGSRTAEGAPNSVQRACMTPRSRPATAATMDAEKADELPTPMPVLTRTPPWPGRESPRPSGRK